MEFAATKPAGRSRGELGLPRRSIRSESSRATGGKGADLVVVRQDSSPEVMQASSERVNG